MAPGGTSRRTLRLRPGLLGGGPRWAVRGCREGRLDLGGRPRRVLLVDGDADGGFDDAGADRCWVDLDGDGRFDPASERLPLGTPIRADGASSTIATDPWGLHVQAVARDDRTGSVRLTLGANCATGHAGSRQSDGRTASILLKAPDGRVLDRASSGFQ